MYTVTVGLEVHAELKTVTKMFCACKNDADERNPNMHICPVCMAHPGTLPVINKEAVRKVLMVGSAVGGTLADYTEFDRKNYFYPDIPKGYQISQYKHPLVSGGTLAGVALTRIHLEEDTARSQHDSEKSLVDYNRAGVPLMELVTEPVIHSPEQAGVFARELQLLLRTLGAGDVNMEKGEMRVEANISVSNDDRLGTKVEVKNLNSFRSVERAIAFEVERQTALLERGETVMQETRGWDEVAEKTFSQRKKESAHDYRYFPDPDLPSMRLSQIPEYGAIKLPELPWQKRARYIGYGIGEENAAMFVTNPHYGTLFDSAQHLQPAATKLISNYISSDIAGLVTKQGDEGLRHITPEGLAAVLRLFTEEKISSRGVKDAIADVFTNGGDLAQVANKYLQQNDAEALEIIAGKVISANGGVVQEYRSGKEAALQFLVGQGMKESRGSANPAALKAVFQKLLS